jgi:hypothetical protein
MINTGVDRTAVTPSAPSGKALGIASAVAVCVAALVLVTAVLPAEYGIDPLGTGEAWGLSAISQAGVTELPPATGEQLAPTAQGNISWYAADYKFDSRTIVLPPYQYIEYKYHLSKDAVMLFSWSADGQILQHFHGDPDGATTNSATQSYDQQPRQQEIGSFTAPFDGIHGWYWENAEGRPVTVKLTTAGFYTSAHEFHSNRTRTTRPVQGLESIPASDQ